MIIFNLIVFFYAILGFYNSVDEYFMLCLFMRSLKKQTKMTFYGYNEVLQRLRFNSNRHIKH